MDMKKTNSIQLKLHDVSRLFNSMDPSPFIEKDLDNNAEEFIVSWAQEFSPGAPVKLKIYLEQWPAEDPNEMIRHAVHFYFAHRTQMAALDFKRLMKQGRTSLLIGLAFLVACLVASKALLTGQESTWASTLRESLTIAGWVAMWRPMQIYLYDWWPLRKKQKTYSKLSRMPVEVVPPETKKPAADQQREHGEAHPHDRCPTLQASRPPRAHQERRADTDIDHARELAALDTSEQISDGFGATLGAVQVLLDLGLADDAIATYLLRFNFTRIDD